MVVDDEVAQLWVDVLKSEGFEVDGFNCPVEAEKAFGLKEYDLLVSDFSMPKIMGDELLMRLKKKKPPLRALMVSGHMDAPMAAQTAGYDVFVSKPASIGEFLRGVRSAIDSHRTDERDATERILP